MRQTVTILAVLLGCGKGSSEPDGNQITRLFSLAVIADSHVTGPGDRADKLEAAIAWLNAETKARDLELVVVVGDIGWDDGIGLARELLDQLDVPYLPLIGDNEIHNGTESDFEATYASHFADLAATLDNWQAAPWPVSNPEVDGDSWLQNLSFDYRGIHFIGLDFASRSDDEISGELGTLHDFAGGSLPWLEARLAEQAGGADDSVIMLSHIPMHNGAFDVAEMNAIEAALEPYRDQVYGNLAGHVHLSYEVAVTDLYDAYVTAALWYDGLINLRLVSVGDDGEGLVLQQELVVVPE